MQHDTVNETNCKQYLRGEVVVIAKADFLDSNGVILIDDGNCVICQKLLKSVSGVQVWPSVTQVVQGEQDLCACLQTITEQ